jgi:hypothetical protein
LVRVVAVGEGVVQAALDSEFADVEDAMQYFSALSVPNLVAIVTGDPKGFKTGSLKVISPVVAQQLLSE